MIEARHGDAPAPRGARRHVSNVPVHRLLMAGRRLADDHVLGDLIGDHKLPVGFGRRRGRPRWRRWWRRLPLPPGGLGAATLKLLLALLSGCALLLASPLKILLMSPRGFLALAQLPIVC